MEVSRCCLRCQICSFVCILPLPVSVLEISCCLLITRAAGPGSQKMTVDPQSLIFNLVQWFQISSLIYSALLLCKVFHCPGLSPGALEMSLLQIWNCLGLCWLLTWCVFPEMGCWRNLGSFEAHHGKNLHEMLNGWRKSHFTGMGYKQ